MLNPAASQGLGNTDGVEERGDFRVAAESCLGRLLCWAFFAGNDRGGVADATQSSDAHYSNKKIPNGDRICVWLPAIVRSALNVPFSDAMLSNTSTLAAATWFVR